MQDKQASPGSARAYILRELAVPASDLDPDLAGAIAGFLRIKRSRVGGVKILRKSLDSRKRNQPLWRYSLEFTYVGDLKHPKVAAAPAGTDGAPAGAASKHTREGAGSNDRPAHPSHALRPEDALPAFRPSGPRVAVIGSGPAGMAAAMGLVRKGYRVTVFEQGSDVGKRFQDIRRFLKQNVFNPHSNILFGEGGAGTFSDGKLTCRTRTRFTETFLKELVASGADEDIVYLSHPHIGTDRLQFIVKTWRERCQALGCEFRFNTPVESILTESGRISGVTVGGGPEAFDALVLAAGHSSRPLYRRLAELGVAMERKPFSVGVRVEHPQDMVNRRQLGEKVNPSMTGAAEYYLTWNAEAEGLSAYSFCMCPGGVVVPCADEKDGLFTNGMSYSNRAGAFANSAVVVPVTPADLAGGDVLAGMDFIRDLEVKAYRPGRRGFRIPGPDHPGLPGRSRGRGPGSQDLFRQTGQMGQPPAPLHSQDRPGHARGLPQLRSQAARFHRARPHHRPRIPHLLSGAHPARSPDLGVPFHSGIVPLGRRRRLFRRHRILRRRRIPVGGGMGCLEPCGRRLQRESEFQSAKCELKS